MAMPSTKVKTNNQPRQLRTWSDLSKEEQGEFDWMEPEQQETASFVRYKGWNYSMDCFCRLDDGHLKAAGWHGYVSNNAFQAVLIKLLPDNSDYVVMGVFNG